MSSIHDALKRAQQERDRLRQAPAPTTPPVTAAERESVVVPASPPDATPLTAALVQHQTISVVEAPVAVPASATNSECQGVGVSTSLTPVLSHIDTSPQPPAPLTHALKQSPASLSVASPSAAQTIVEDYASKRNLALPPALVVYHDRTGRAAEQYRRLRNSLLSAAATGPRLYVLTSTLPQEGTTTALLNLGLSLLELRHTRVLLLDGHLTSPTLSGLLKTHPAPGLADLLASDSLSPESLFKATPWHNLFLLPAGSFAALPPTALAATALLQRPRTRTLLQHLRNMFDVLLIDAPPALACPDAGLLTAAGAHPAAQGPSGDGLLLAVRLHHTPRQKVLSTLRLFDSLSLPLKGTLLTHAS